ncbi:MAG: hypothetical protein AAGC46_06135 [Solirubrobacteraceae bacterium]|nr:hypothetical protein [Patulibacter sp.]
MSHIAPSRIRPLVAALVLAVLLAIAAALAPGAHLATSGAAASTAEPATYYVVRTRELAGADAKASQAVTQGTGRCNAHFGVKQFLTLTRLDAMFFQFTSNASTGRIEDQTTKALGPGYLCGVPGTKGNDIDAYAYGKLAVGTVDASGGCRISPQVLANVPVITSCLLTAKPQPAQGIDGALITSNSIVNLLDKNGAAPTGSVWTAQVFGHTKNPVDTGAVKPAGIQPETPGLDFFVVRTRNETTPSTSPDCARAGVSGTPLAIRTADLAAAQPDATGKVPEPSGPSAGKLTVCYAYVSNKGYRAFAIADLHTASKTFSVRSVGDCKVSTTAAGADVRGLTCALDVKSGAKGGLVTSNGLIDAGKPASAANSSVWTFALFGAPAAS